MKLLTQEIKKRLLALYGTESTPLADKIVQFKLFTPDSNWTWYVLEGSDEGTDFVLWGLVCGFEKEFGYTSLRELEGARGPLGLKIERDLYFTPKPLKDLPDAAELLRRLEAA